MGNNPSNFTTTSGLRLDARHDFVLALVYTVWIKRRECAMPEVTLDTLTARLAEVELELATLKGEKAPSKNGWRKYIGIFDDDPDFMRQVIAEGQAIREAGRQLARSGVEE